MKQNRREKFFHLLQPYHYRYIIAGIITFWMNYYFTDSIFLRELLPITSQSAIHEFLISSSITLIISYPLHKFFTFADGFDAIWIKFFKFILVGVLVLAFRVFLFSGFLHLGIPNSYSFIISTFLIVLINFVAFDLFVFPQIESPHSQEITYGEGGAGVTTLETIEEAVNYNTWISDKITDYLSEKNLELGAGQGTISAILVKRFKLELFEISDSNQSVLQNRFAGEGSSIQIGRDFLQNKDFGKYDCIYSSNVLEHIEEDIFFILHGMKLLKQGGYFVAFVPAMQFLYSPMDKILGHFRRYSKTDKKRIINYLNQSNISHKFLQYKFLNPIGCVGWLLKMRILKMKKINKADMMIMNSALPFISFLDYLPIPFGQSIFFVIKKL